MRCVLAKSMFLLWHYLFKRSRCLVNDVRRMNNGVFKTMTGKE
ncbi:hypothetical protein T06_11057 [Trichinella sp. T6]|nr:hypothetical protein T06_11057 [Trichinella sp. T6]